MGNALRQAIIANTDEVDFCGYSVPHPAEVKMRLRIQAKEGVDANIIDILNTGIDNFGQWCENVQANFDQAFADYQAKM